MRLPRQIYSITHEPTQKRYIGSSANVPARFKAHMSHLQRGTHPVEGMQADFDHFGGSYSLEILGDIRDFSERKREYGWMLWYASYDPQYGYNYKDRSMAYYAAEGSHWRDPDILSILAQHRITQSRTGLSKEGPPCKTS